MAFGYVPGDPILNTKEYCLAEGIRRFDGIRETLLQLDVGWKAIEYCTRGQAGQNFLSEGFSKSLTTPVPV